MYFLLHLLSIFATTGVGICCFHARANKSCNQKRRRAPAVVCGWFFNQGRWGIATFAREGDRGFFSVQPQTRRWLLFAASNYSSARLTTEEKGALAWGASVFPFFILWAMKGRRWYKGEVISNGCIQGNRVATWWPAQIWASRPAPSTVL